MGYPGRPAPHSHVPRTNQRHASLPAPQSPARTDRVLQKEQDSAAADRPHGPNAQWQSGNHQAGTGSRVGEPRHGRPRQSV